MEVTKAANLFLWNFLGKMKQKVFETIILWFAFLSLQTCTILIVNAKKLLTFVLGNPDSNENKGKACYLNTQLKKVENRLNILPFCF